MTIEHLYPAPQTDALSVEAIGHCLCALMPENAILLEEGGATGAHICELAAGGRPHELLKSECDEVSGRGLLAALGAALICPQRKTILLQGDGGQAIAEKVLGSMAREKADVTVILLKKNKRLDPETKPAGNRPSETMSAGEFLTNPARLMPDRLKVAQGHGLPAGCAFTAEEFHQQFAAAMTTGGPHLIEAHIFADTKPVTHPVHNSKCQASHRNKKQHKKTLK